MNIKTYKLSMLKSMFKYVSNYENLKIIVSE